MDTKLISEALARHDRVALQLSGGRDSIACLYMLRDYLDQLTVYWLNTGDAYPETLQVIRHVRGMVPNFVEISGNQPGIIEAYGIPSDIVPASRTPIGLLGSGSTAPAIQDRYTCCAESIMLPLHKRMLDDGITLIIRGQKNADKLKGTLRSGQVDQGIEYLFPIEDWSARQVSTYLRYHGAPIPRFYELMDSAPDCMTCSAWWENGAARYLKRYHQPQYVIVQQRLAVINEAIAPHIEAFNEEVK